MGLVLKEYVGEDCLMGLWEISEIYEELFAKALPDKEETDVIESFRNHERKLEWLSVRVLLKEMIGNNNRIIYDDNNKPFLTEGAYNISISHSHKLTTILLSKTKKVGIDLEYMTHRIEKIQHKFINISEQITNDPRLRKYHLYIHWCAKEALYKICDKQDINFKENLVINTFIPQDNGKIKGMVNTVHTNDVVDLSYFRMKDYIIVWCAK